MKEVLYVDLNGEWNIDQVSGDISIKGRIPGVVHMDLLQQGIIEDPYYRRNELQQQWISGSAWDYSRDFDITEEQLSKERIVLNAEGVDVLADFFVNDKLVASTDNLFRRYRFDIKKYLQVGKNRIRIQFKPVVDEAVKRFKEYPFFVGNGPKSGPVDPEHRNFIRTCQCHFGWDWGVCLIPQGIYNDLTIECFDEARILYVTHQQTHNHGNVDVCCNVTVESACSCDGELKIKLGDVSETCKCRLKKGENTFSAILKIEDPELWWPNGAGPQNLHDLSVEINTNDGKDIVKQKIGLRKLELVRDQDEAGETFYFRINDVDIFAKGSNWIPSDSFDPRLTNEQLAWELGSAADAHQNIIRVWGGGLYERDRFYELCDELGLLVWQDFMFACALYPTNPEFLENVREEVKHQIRRLAYHPSLALWCGNNENEWALGWEKGKDSENVKINTTLYDELYIQTIQPLVNELDPDRHYWPSSPSNGIRRYGDPNDCSRGDTHYWGVWHQGLPFSEYLKVKPRFSSEFGFQSFSSPETMDSVTKSEDRNISSEVFEHHQRSGQGNLTILNHIARQFLIPVGYENMLYVSQALQALSIKTACEHWRRIKPHNMGTIIWQLNDIWPVASWSSIEYDGRWKMLHYYQRHFYAPLLVSAVENGDNIEIWATSDVNDSLQLDFNMRLIDFTGKKVLKDTSSIDLDPLASKVIATYKIDDLCQDEQAKKRLCMDFSLTDGGVYTNRNQWFFAPFKKLELKCPDIKYDFKDKKDCLTIELSTDTLAPFVWLRHGDIHGTWTDNGMHLLPGEKVKLSFKPRNTSLTLKKMERALVIHNLYNAGFPSY